MALTKRILPRPTESPSRRGDAVPHVVHKPATPQQQDHPPMKRGVSSEKYRSGIAGPLDPETGLALEPD